MGVTTNIINDDMEFISEVLAQFSAYRFSDDIQQRMDIAGLSSVALAERCIVSHTIVDRWKSGKSRPNGKERIKEIGMALGMDSDSLNEFLLCNGYPGLYLKNPLDSAARLLLLNSSGRPDIVSMYRELVERLGLSLMTTVDEEAPLATAIMSMDLKQAVEDDQISRWFSAYKGQFTGNEKTQFFGWRLVRFMLLYMGDATIHEMAVAGEMPAALRNLLYPIVAGKGVGVRFLREKLIAFGLYVNMTENEMDILMQCARLRPFSEPVTTLDLALLSALRCAHERYPLYEYENLLRITKRLSASKDDYDIQLLEQYSCQKDQVKKLVDYYEKHERSVEELDFEREYTSLQDKGVIDYVHDLLSGLLKVGCLEMSETVKMMELIKRKKGEM